VKGFVEIDKNALTLPVMLGDSLRGYIFHGNGKLVLDMIIETGEGAIGRPVENRTDHPFMMLGRTEAVRSSLSPASQEDFSGFGYAKQQDFVAKAEDLLNRFHGRTLGIRGCRFSSARDGVAFAFQKETNEADILFAEGEKIVYKTRGTVFVSDGNKAVLKGSHAFVCISNGKSLFVRR
jgi:hypothetical protein